VSRNIHESNTHFAQVEKCEAKVNRDAAALFFFEPIRVRASKGGDERGLAVINVPGRANDDVLHGFASWLDGFMA
jgi:hypothetical protein